MIDVGKAREINEKMSQFYKSFSTVRSSVYEIQQRKFKLFEELKNYPAKYQETLPQLENLLKLEKKYFGILAIRFRRFYEVMKGYKNIVSELSDEEVKQLSPKEDFYRLFKEFWNISFELYEAIENMLLKIEVKIKKEKNEIIKAAYDFFPSKEAQKRPIAKHPVDYLPVNRHVKKFVNQWKKEADIELHAKGLYGKLNKLRKIKDKIDETSRILKHVRYKKEDTMYLIVLLGGIAGSGFYIFSILLASVFGIGIKFMDALHSRNWRKDRLPF